LAWLTELVRAIHADSRGTYGWRRVNAELTYGHGVIVNRKTVRKVMRIQGLHGLPGSRKTFRSKVNMATAADLVERRFDRTAPDQLWVTDITEHPTREGKVYCCVVLDVFSRRVVGWSIDSHQATPLVTGALGMAINNRNPGPDQTVIHSRGALRRDLAACLRTGRALRVPRARSQGRGKKFISPEIMISQRPAEVEDRAVPGRWEGDRILGLGSSAIGTLVERTTRFTLLLHLPRMTGHGQPRVKNGPALAGHGAEAVRDAIATSITTLPDQLRRSLTWDQGAEMAQHAELRIDIGLATYFCDPHSPWQRGTNENTNGLLRQYFPKGTDLSNHSAGDLAAVAAALNRRPRKTLGWRTPAEALDDLLHSGQHGSVATTP